MAERHCRRPAHGCGCTANRGSGPGRADNPVWSIPADSKNWFANDNNTRGFAFNEATGNLIVFSRTGGLKPVILDAATARFSGRAGCHRYRWGAPSRHP